MNGAERKAEVNGAKPVADVLVDGLRPTGDHLPIELDQLVVEMSRLCAVLISVRTSVNWGLRYLSWFVSTIFSHTGVHDSLAWQRIILYLNKFSAHLPC